MRFDPRAACSPSILALAAALTLSACSDGNAGGTQPTPALTATATPAATPGTEAATASTDVPMDEAAPDLSEYDLPFKVPIPGPVENEEAVDKAPTLDFPAAASKARPKLEGLPADDPALGAPLVINGTVVPFDEVRKQVCLGVLGMGEIADARTKIFIDEERQRRVENQISLEGTEVGGADVEKYLTDVEENIKTEYPDGSVGMVDVLNEIGSYDPKEKLRFQMEFARLFLPEDPNQFPPSTLEAILKNQGGQGVLDHYKSSYDPSAPKREKEPGEQQFDQAIMQQILAYLIDTATVTVDPAPGVLYRVNGVDIRMDDIWNRIRPRVTPEAVLAAKQWIVNTTLLEQHFKQKGAWLNDEEAYIAYHAHSDPYKDSIFSMERVALLVKLFPSIERYTLHHRLQDSFQRERNPSAEELEAYAKKRTNKIVGQVKADVDILLCSAYDFKKGAWIEHGWEDAENRMRDVLRLLVEEQRPWDELMERYSDFWERPVPQSQQGLVDPNRPQKGRYRDVQRNGLLGQLGETDYGMFLTGTSVTDFIFFDQEVGTVGQPIRGPFGWYLPKLIRRTKPPMRIPMDEQTQKDLVLDDYLTTELNNFAQELIRKNEVYGLHL